MSPDLDVATRLAFDRTRLAYDRTMMAWVRTSTSMITFGFSVYKFFQLGGDQTARAARVIGPREFSFLMVGLGIAALLAATLEYGVSMKSLKAEYPGIFASPLTTIAAVSMAVLGLLALIAVIFGR